MLCVGGGVVHELRPCLHRAFRAFLPPVHARLSHCSLPPTYQLTRNSLASDILILGPQSGWGR